MYAKKIKNSEIQNNPKHSITYIRICLSGNKQAVYTLKPNMIHSASIAYLRIDRY